MLSSVVLASLQGARESAKATEMASNFRQIRTGLIMWMQRTGRTTWRDESGYYFITDFREDTTLDEYLNPVPRPPFGSLGYRYDNDQDVFNCGGDVTKGVNIYVGGVPQDKAKQVSRVVDGDEDLDCGRVRYDPSGGNDLLLYLISKDESF